MRRLLALGFVLAALAAAMPESVASQAKSEKPKASSAPATPIDLNTATAAQLEKLPGIGARTAQLIIEHRQKNGGFKKVEELMNIKGIGEKSFLKLKPLVTIATDKAGRSEDSR
jgi:competence protein ComEA